MTPTAPGVNDATLASDPEPKTHMIELNVTGMAKAARKIPVTTILQHQDRNDGRNACLRYVFGSVRMAPPCLACSQSFLTFDQRIRPTITISTAPPTMIRIVSHGYALRLPPKLTSNEFGTLRNM